MRESSSTPSTGDGSRRLVTRAHPLIRRRRLSPASAAPPRRIRDRHIPAGATVIFPIAPMLLGAVLSLVGCLCAGQAEALLASPSVAWPASGVALCVVPAAQTVRPDNTCSDFGAHVRTRRGVSPSAGGCLVGPCGRREGHSALVLYVIDSKTCPMVLGFGLLCYLLRTPRGGSLMDGIHCLTRVMVEESYL